MGTQTQIRLKQIEKITSLNVTEAIDNQSISALQLVADVTDDELGYLAGVTESVQTQLLNRLKIDILKKDADIPDWADDAIVVTAKAIAQKIADEIALAQIGGVMVYKKAWSTRATDSSTIKAGYTYCYDGGQAPEGHQVEIGDMIVVQEDNPSITKTDDWQVVQANISGAVTTLSTSVYDKSLVVFDGNSGKLIKSCDLNGIVALTNGVPREVSADDLPNHTHTIIVQEATDTLGKFVKGLSISADGVIELHYAYHPVRIAGEKPIGAVNGTNQTFEAINSPMAGTDELIINGQVMTRDEDYSIDGKFFTLKTEAYIPQDGDIVRINYMYQKTE